MHQNHYTTQLLRYVAGLTNRPAADGAELATRWIAAGVPLEQPIRGCDLAEVRDYLLRWQRLVDAPSEQRRVDLLNAMLMEYSTYPRISDHDNTGWHIHYRDDDICFGRMLRAANTVATAQHLTDHGMHRLGRCALADCAHVYVDESRGGRQRYCSRSCANRDAVRRHRASRTRETGPEI